MHEHEEKETFEGKAQLANSKLIGKYHSEKLAFVNKFSHYLLIKEGFN